MTDSKNYKVRGADVIVTASVYPTYINLTITIDLTDLDRAEPSYTAHNLIQYLDLPNYKLGASYWWCKTQRDITVRTGSQAHRVIKNALAKIDDAVAAAEIARTARKMEMQNVWK